MSTFSSRHPPRSNQPSTHNRTTHAAFANTVRNTLDAPLPPTPPSQNLPSAYSSSSSSSSNLAPRFRNSAPLPRRGSALQQSATANGWDDDTPSAPRTPPSPSGRSASPNTNSETSTLLNSDSQPSTTSLRREYIPSRAFANAQESPPSRHQHYATGPGTHSYSEEEQEVTIRPSPGRSVAAAARRAPPFRPSQSAHLRSGRASGAPAVQSSRSLDPPTSLPRYIEEMYLDLGVVAALPSLEPRDHLASIEAMNHSIAVWMGANPVAGLHVMGLVQRLRIGARFEGTLRLGDAGEWMRRRGLSGADEKGEGEGEGMSFAQRVRRMGNEVAGEKKDRSGDDDAAVATAAVRGIAITKVHHTEAKWRELPLVVVLMYSEVCDVHLTRMSDREGREMLADWAGRYWPVSDENMIEVMIEWGSEMKGKVDVDPRKWRREDEGKVERLIEKIRGLSVGEVRRGGTLVERLMSGARRSVSVRMSKR